jgi:hypothetical protein
VTIFLVVTLSSKAWVRYMHDSECEAGSSLILVYMIV